MAQKTELPTEKKRKDSAKKGKMLKNKDLVTTVTLLAGCYFIPYGITFVNFISFYTMLLNGNIQLSLNEFLQQMMKIFFHLSFPLIISCCVAGIIATLLQTRFTIATEAIKMNFAAVNPVAGMKKILTLRTLKELAKSLCFLIVFFCTCYSLTQQELKQILTIHNTGIAQLVLSLLTLMVKAVTVFTAWSILVLVADFIAEYFLHFKDLKMDKHEVKQERKESDGNPLVKSARRRAHQELLSGQELAAIRNSAVVMANPTHIAIAVYFNPDIASLPFIAFRATNSKAKAALSYANEIGIPVVHNIPLARRLYRDYSQYSFISLNDDALMEVMDIIIWFRQVETASG